MHTEFDVSFSPKKLAVCDSTSDSSDDTGSCASADDTTPEDVGKLVKRPQDLAERSGNAKTKASFLLKHKGADDMTPEDDTKFIKKAHDLAKRSGDEKTKVSFPTHRQSLTHTHTAIIHLSM